MLKRTLGGPYLILQLGGSCCPQTISLNLGHQVLRIDATDESLKQVILCQDGCI